MPRPEALAAFAAMAFLLIAIPGPSVLFVIGRSLTLGRRGGLLSVLGNELGGLPLVALVAFGLGGIVAQSVVLFTIVKLIGAVYLAYLGVQAIRHRRAGAVTAVSAEQPASAWRVLRQGIIVGMTNPKTVVFFVAALPQFVDIGAGHVPLQMILLGVIFTLIAFVCDSCWALLAASARTWLVTSPRRLSVIRGTGGGLMVGLGVSLAFTPAKA